MEWHPSVGEVANVAILLRYARLRPADLHGAAAEYRSSACATYRKTEQGCRLVYAGVGRRGGRTPCWQSWFRDQRRYVASPVASDATAGAPHVPRVLGIDDWAWRKGQRYGTILCDLELGRVVDLLPDRTVETVAAWLREHPGVEIISRDRASAYAEAARTAAPKAIQVADRWHLLRNVVEALQRLLESKHRLLTQTAKAVVGRRDISTRGGFP